MTEAANQQLRQQQRPVRRQPWGDSGNISSSCWHHNSCLRISDKFTQLMQMLFKEKQTKQQVKF